VNPDATPEAVNLFNFLQDIQGNYTLSGMHNFLNNGSTYSNDLAAMTGKKPVVWGTDFSFCVQGEDALRFQHCGPANLPAISWKEYIARRDSIRAAGESWPPVLSSESPGFLDLTLDEARSLAMEEIKARHADGHIITLMWHGCYPTEGDCCEGSSIWAMENRPSPGEWDELVTPGTELNEAWKRSANKIASYLKLLQDARIPVLWRPYHEMNGVWFWWCNQKGEEGFRRLWIMMYDYFTHEHQLNNLIWVWNTNAPRDIPGDEAWPYADFFPGIEYVDILAADVYHNDFRQSHHDDLLELAEGKPIALGEVGNIPTPEILEVQRDWTWFMPWGWILFVASDEEDIRELYQSPQVLTLDEVSRDQGGNYIVKQ
jgi:mannan endo-1,4-beta-mannosidase